MGNWGKDPESLLRRAGEFRMTGKNNPLE